MSSNGDCRKADHSYWVTQSRCREGCWEDGPRPPRPTAAPGGQAGPGAPRAGCPLDAGHHGGRLPAVGPLAPGRVAELAARNAAAASARRLGAPLPLGRPAGGGGGRAAGRRGSAAAAASREVAEPRRRLRAAGDGAAAAPHWRPACVGALGFLQGGGPAAVAGLRAAGGGGACGRRHVPADDARHPAALRRLQEVRLRPAALPLSPGGNAPRRAARCVSAGDCWLRVVPRAVTPWSPAEDLRAEQTARALPCVASHQHSVRTQLVEARGCGGGHQLHPVDENLCTPWWLAGTWLHQAATPACVWDPCHTGATGKQASGLPCCVEYWLVCQRTGLEGSAYRTERCCCCRADAAASTQRNGVYTWYIATGTNCKTGSPSLWTSK